MQTPASRKIVKVFVESIYHQSRVLIRTAIVGILGLKRGSFSLVQRKNEIEIEVSRNQTPVHSITELISSGITTKEIVLVVKEAPVVSRVILVVIRNGGESFVMIRVILKERFYTLVI